MTFFLQFQLAGMHDIFNMFDRRCVDMFKLFLMLSLIKLIIDFEMFTSAICNIFDEINCRRPCYNKLDFRLYR